MDAPTLARWLQERLSSDAAQADWRRILESGVEGILKKSLSEVAPASAFSRGLDAVLTDSRLEELARASVRLGLAPAAEKAQDDDEPVGRWLGDDARARLEALAAREGLIDEEWVDVVFSQEAMRELFAETLFRALHDFAETIPQVVQSLTPAAFGKIASKLTGASGGVGDRMREEIRSRLEPEIRRFVERATRRLLDGTAGFVKAGLDRDGTREARKNLLRHALQRPVSSYARHFDEQGLADLEATFVAMARGPEVKDRARTRLISMHDELLKRFGGASLRATMAAHNVEPTPDYDALTEASWPAVRAFVAAEGVGAFLEGFAQEILDVVSED